MVHHCSMSVSVVMAAYNESEYLEDAVCAVRRCPAVSEIIVVENGSTDATADVARRLEAQVAGVRALTIDRADYGAALKHGLQHAVCESIVIFDVDYYDLDFLQAAVSRLDDPDQPAIVVGSKRAPGAHDDRPAMRRLFTSTFSLVLRLGFGLQASDTHGMKAMRRRLVIGIVEQCRLGADLFDTELVLRTERAGLQVAEIPVTVEEHRPSRTSIARRGLRSVTGLGRLRLVLWRHR